MEVVQVEPDAGAVNQIGGAASREEAKCVTSHEVKREQFELDECNLAVYFVQKLGSQFTASTLVWVPARNTRKMAIFGN